jgi:two-component system, LuxR family, sensor kinase FixL
MTIRLRLALIVFAVTIPMLILFAATAWRLADQTRARSQQTIAHAARPIMIAIDAELGKYMVGAHALAVSASLKTPDFPAFREEAEQAMPQMPGVWVTLTDADGQQLINTMLSEPEAQQHLRPFDRAVAGPVRPLEQRRMQVSDLRPGVVSDASMISVTMPVTAGETSGFVLALNIDPVVFRGVLNSQGLAEDWVAEIIDRTGAIIARSRDHENWTGKFGLIRAPSGDNSEKTFETQDSRGVAVIAASSTSPLSGWSTVIAADKAVVDAPIREVVASTLMIGFATTIMSLAFASVGARRITTPIETLEKGAEALRNRQTISLSPTGVPELDRAMLAFDSASKSLLVYETERSRAELFLKSSEARLRLFVEQAPASIAIFDRAMNCLSASQRFLVTHGVDGNEIGGRLFEKLLPDCGQRWALRLQSVLSGEALQQENEKFVLTDGRAQWLSWEMRPWRTPDSEIGGVVLFTVDVSLQNEATKLRNEAMEALSDSEERLRLLIDCAKDYAIFMLDPEGRVISWNEGARRTIGYDTHEIVGQHFSVFFTRDEVMANAPQHNLSEALRSGLLQEEGERVKKDGMRILVSALTSVLFGPNGGLKGYAIIIRDITETKLAEHALRTSETLLRAVVDGSPDAIVAINGDGIVQSVNGNGIKMFGYERQEIVGSNVKILIPDHYGNHDLHLKGYLQNGRRQVLDAEREVEGRRKDGSIFPLGLLVTETTYADMPLFVGFLRDLSDRREIETRIKQLQGERLSAMGGLAAGLAHELNQPLTAAVSFLETAQLLDGMSPTSGAVSLAGTLSSAIDEIMRAGQIMKRLRQFVATGEPDKTFVNLHDFIRDPAAFFLLKKQGIEVELNLEAPSDCVLADAVQVRQVLSNLTKNAVEAMSLSDDRRLRIATTPSAHGMIRVDVSDTGCGLAPHVLKNLFEPFQTTKQNGIGIGLSISRIIIEAHYGRIWASANPDGGTTFSFTLPLGNAEPFDEQQADRAFS